MEKEKKKWFGRQSGDAYSEGRLLGLVNITGNALLVGVLFLIGCIPVVTVGTSLSAFYYAMIKSVRKERGYPTKEFFRSYKRNLLKGIAYTVVLVLIGGLLVFNRFFYLAGQDGAAVVAVVAYDVMLVFFAAFMVWIFPVISRFDFKAGTTILLTFTIAARFFYFTILLIAAWVLTIYLCLKLSVGFTLLIPPFVCYFSTFIIERAFGKYTPKPKDNEDGWYYDGE